MAAAVIILPLPHQLKIGTNLNKGKNVKTIPIPEKDINEIRCLATKLDDCKKKWESARREFLMADLQRRQAHDELFERTEKALPEMLDHQNYRINTKEGTVEILPVSKDESLLLTARSPAEAAFKIAKAIFERMDNPFNQPDNDDEQQE